MLQTKTYKFAWAAIAIGAVLLVLNTIPTAQAATTTELQMQIQTLLAQIEQLKALLGGGTTANAACPYTWSRSLTIGSTGPDVQKLQQFLNNDPSTTVATFGAGSKGAETQYYGPATAAAVTKFQNKYHSEVLAPYGLTLGTGYFGPSTIAKANTLCIAAPVVTPKPTTPIPTTPPVTKGGDEASLERYKTSGGDDTNLNEAQKNARVMDVEFTVKDGDVSINRVDVAVDHQLGSEDDPWDTFRNISLIVNGKEVAAKNTSNKDDWSKNDPYTGAYKIRFSGLDIKVKEDDKAEFTVAVSIHNSVSGATNGLSWDIFIPTDGIRARDGAGIDQYTGSNSETVNIDINKKGSDDEISVRSASSDPDATVLALEENKRSDWHTVFAFDLDTDTSINDIELEELPVAFTVSSSTVGTFLSDVRLKVGSQTYDQVSITDGPTNHMVFMFDTGDFVIDAGDRTTVEVQARFNALSNAYEGVTIYGAASSTDIVAYGVDDLSATQLSGAATGDTHSLRTKGAILNPVSTAAVLKVNTSDDITDDEGSFKITFTVESFKSDLYINKTAASGTVMGVAGVNYIVKDTLGNQVVDGTSIASLSSDAKTVGNQYVVREGEQKKFTLNVNYDPLVSGFYHLQLHSLNVATTSVDPTIQQLALPESRYQTDPLSI